MSRIYDENGQVLVDEVEVIERWKEQFKMLCGDTERTYQDVPLIEAAEEDSLEVMMEGGRSCVKRFTL